MTESLKNMLTSVDWKKLLSSQDAKNALVGSALGGAILGGASLFRDRDPEESKLTPVGDALTGALLGGVAGYGIPKGLSLFRHGGGSMAPDNDQLKSNYLGWGLAGGAAGAGTIGLSIAKTLGNESKALKENALLPQAMKALDAARGKPGEAAAQARLNRIVHALENRRDDIASDFRGLIRNIRQGRFADAWSRQQEIRHNIQRIHQAEKGYSGIVDLIHRAGNKPNRGLVSGLKNMILHPQEHFRNFSSGAHYSPGHLAVIGPRVGTRVRMLERAGKYGAIGAGGAMLLHALFGSGTHNNYKN